jgi:DNA-binding MarR family transcriptional regulator
MKTETEGAFRITVNDKILVHLLEYTRYNDRPEVPREITQQGISEIVGARRSHVSLALSTLRERSLVEEKTVRVTDEVRRRKGYFLTSKGFETAKGLAEKYQMFKVRIEEAGGVKEAMISELPQLLGEKYYLVDVLCCLNKDGTLDIAELTGQKAEAIQEDKTKAPLARAMAACPMCATRVEFPYDNEAILTVVCGSCGNTFRTSVGSPVYAPQSLAQVEVTVPVAATQKSGFETGLMTLLAGLAISVAVSLIMLTSLFFISCGLLLGAFPLLLVSIFSLKKQEDRAQVAFGASMLFAAPFFILSDSLMVFWVGLQFAGTFALAAAVANVVIKSLRLRLTMAGACAIAASLVPAAVPWGIPLGFGLLIGCATLMTAVIFTTEVKETREKHAIAVSGFVAAFGAVSYMHWMIVPTWDMLAIARIALVTATLYAFAAFAKPVAAKTRAEIVSVLGVFLIALGTFTAVTSPFIGWESDLAAYLAVFGGGAAYAARMIRKQDNLWAQVCMGAGFFLAVISVSLIITRSSTLSLPWLVSLGLWLAVGLSLCAIRFAREVTEWVVSVRAGTIAAAGASVILAGVYMLTLGFGAEGAVELALGTPLVGYAVLRSGAPWVPRLAVSSLLVAAVAATWYAVAIGLG